MRAQPTRGFFAPMPRCRGEGGCWLDCAGGKGEGEADGERGEGERGEGEGERGECDGDADGVRSIT